RVRGAVVDERDGRSFDDREGTRLEKGLDRLLVDGRVALELPDRQHYASPSCATRPDGVSRRVPGPADTRRPSQSRRAPASSAAQIAGAKRRAKSETRAASS